MKQKFDEKSLMRIREIAVHAQELVELVAKNEELQKHDDVTVQLMMLSLLCSGMGDILSLHISKFRETENESS